METWSEIELEFSNLVYHTNTLTLTANATERQRIHTAFADLRQEQPIGKCGKGGRWSFEKDAPDTVTLLQSYAILL